MSEFILHATSRAAWSAAQAAWTIFRRLVGRARASSIAPKSVQILRVANVFYAGQHGLVLLVIDPGRLTSELRWEPGTDLATELFPHIYGPINLDAVVQVVDFEPAADGKFHLPKSLEFAGR